MTEMSRGRAVVWLLVVCSVHGAFAAHEITKASAAKSLCQIGKCESL